MNIDSKTLAHVINSATDEIQDYPLNSLHTAHKHHIRVLLANEEGYDMPEQLLEAFDWATTPQGFDFWSKEHDNLCAGKRLSPGAVVVLYTVLWDAKG